MKKNKSKKYYVKFFVLVMGLLLLATSFLFADKKIVSADTNVYYDSQSPISINYINLDIKIDEQGVLDVSQEFEVTFLQSGLTEVIYYIPYAGIMYKDDGDGVKRQKYIAKIYDYKLEKLQSGPEELRTYTDEVDNCITFGIKNTSATYSKGDSRAYVLEYKYDMRNPGGEGYDEVYFNLLGQNSSMEIKNVSFKITFPKDVDFSESVPYFYTGRVGTNDKLFTDISVVDNRIIVSNKTLNLKAYEPLTLRIKLPDKYFSINEGYNGKWEIYALIVGIVVFLVAICIKVFKEPRNNIVSPVVLDIPENLTPVLAEFYYKNKVTDKCFASMVVWLAHKGYLSIEVDNTDNKSEPLYLIKQKEFQAKTEEEKPMARLFNKIFVNREVGEKVLFEDLESKHICMAFDEIKQKKNLKSSLITEKGGIFPIVLIVILAWATMGLNYFFASKASLERFNFFVAIYKALNMNFVFLFLMTIITIVFMANNPYTLKKFIFISLGFSLISLLLTMTSGSDVIEIQDMHNGYMFGIGNMLIFMTYMFFPNLKIKEDVLEKKGKLIGLKKFIEMVEKSQLEMLVFENPSLYFEVLPYAYILDVSDKWISHFEELNIAVPDWVAGSSVNFRVFYFNMNESIKTSKNKYNSYRSSGGFSGGSGGFSGGGGGFSGGGGGGGSFGAR